MINVSNLLTALVYTHASHRHLPPHTHTVWTYPTYLVHLQSATSEHFTLMLKYLSNLELESNLVTSNRKQSAAEVSLGATLTPKPGPRRCSVPGTAPAQATVLFRLGWANHWFGGFVVEQEKKPWVSENWFLDYMKTRLNKAFQMSLWMDIVKTDWVSISKMFLFGAETTGWIQCKFLNRFRTLKHAFFSEFAICWMLGTRLAFCFRAGERTKPLLLLFCRGQW